jgi:L-2-hydroxyglutarate oxidase LhgO
MYAFCRAHGLPFQRTGKVIVALQREELPRLRALFLRGRANQVPGVTWLDARQLRVCEPHVQGLAAVYVPTTGIVDYQQVAERMVRDMTERGGHALLNARVEAIHSADGAGATLRVAGQHAPLTSRHVIVCAGLHADRSGAGGEVGRGGHASSSATDSLGSL